MSKLIFNYIFIIAVLTFSSLSIAMDEGQDLREEVNELKTEVAHLKSRLDITIKNDIRTARSLNMLIKKIDESENENQFEDDENDTNSNTDLISNSISRNHNNNKTKSFLETIDPYINIGIFACLFTYVSFVIYKCLTYKPKKKFDAFNELDIYNQHFQKKSLNKTEILEN